MLILNKKSNDLTFSQWIDICNNEGSTILVDKDTTWTSFDVIAKMRTITHIRKIGHCGTLDPFATGLLIVCLGKATKQIYTFQDLPKQYIATIKIGVTTKSFDTEHPEENVKDISKITEPHIIEAVNSFVGTIEQIPPMFSAKIINGRKLYKFARQNIELELKPSIVEIFSMKIINIEMPYITILIDCSKGTYIRALARDIGNYLGVGGYLTDLRRTQIGEHSVENAFRISELLELDRITDKLTN